MWVRYTCIDILMSLLELQQQKLESCIEQCPMGMTKLVDVLSDSREEVRNISLPLLLRLSRVEQIATLLAFSDGYDSLFKIMMQEVFEA